MPYEELKHFISEKMSLILVHQILRRKADAEDPTGGVSAVILQQAN